MELLYIFGSIVLPDCSPLVRDTLAHEKNTKGTQLGHLLTVTSRKSDFVIGFTVGARTSKCRKRRSLLLPFGGPVRNLEVIPKYVTADVKVTAQYCNRWDRDRWLRAANKGPLHMPQASGVEQLWELTPSVGTSSLPLQRFCS